MNRVRSWSEALLDLAKPMTKTSNAVIVFMSAALQLSATNIIKRRVHHHVNRVFDILLLYVVFFFAAKVTPKQEVKACYKCKGAENCKPEKLDGSEIRTSGAFGGKNLYCYTVSIWKLQSLSWGLSLIFPRLRNSTQRLDLLSLVVVLVSASHWIKISNATLNITYAVTRICATSKLLVSVSNPNRIIAMEYKLNFSFACAVCSTFPFCSSQFIAHA